MIGKKLNSKFHGKITILCFFVCCAGCLTINTEKLSSEYRKDEIRNFRNLVLKDILKLINERFERESKNFVVFDSPSQHVFTLDNVNQAKPPFYFIDDNGFVSFNISWDILDGRDSSLMNFISTESYYLKSKGEPNYLFLEHMDFYGYYLTVSETYSTENGFLTLFDIQYGNCNRDICLMVILFKKVSGGIEYSIFNLMNSSNALICQECKNKLLKIRE